MDIEQSTLIWIMRVVFGLVAIVISYGVWHFMRRERLVSVPEKPVYQPPEHIDLPEKIITLTLMARPGHFFDHEHLFSVLQKLGFIYTETQIFEYLVADSDYVAFSLINVRKPYIFDIAEKNTRFTSGLRAVLKLPVADGDQQSNYFHLLLSVLEELGSHLDAELCDANRHPMKDNKLYEIQKEIESFEQSYATLIQNGYQQNH